MADKKEQKIILLPVGRLINGSLFERDIYTDPITKAVGKPLYKVEMAYDPAALEDIYSKPADPVSLYDEFQWAAEEKWGAGIILDVDAKTRDESDEAVETPVLKGDKLAAAREAKGKKGDAYKGKLIIRASTQYNKHGEADVGGVQAFLPDRSEASVATQGEFYNGSLGILAVTIEAKLNPQGDKIVKFWFVAYQKTGDGERLMVSRDTSSLFQAVGKAPGGDAPATRKRRAA